MDYDTWIEKYRPKKLDDIIGQDEVIKRLKEYVRMKNMPHLLFSGTAGVGKTTAALALAREILGDDMWSGNFVELNASDERGIDVVRSKIKDFAGTQSIGNVQFKIIFLDECDALTNDAQSALRRTMEKYSVGCKFILSCNYSSKIIEPIQSRCAVYRFKGISPENIKKRLLYITELERIVVDELSLDAIIYISEGDLRKAVQCLETSSLVGNVCNGKKIINIYSVYKSSGLAHPKYIRELIEIALKGNFVSAVDRLDILIIEEGLNGIDIIKQMFKEIMELNIVDGMKIDLVDRLGECDFRISEGANERIQMKWLITQIIKIGK